MNPQSIIVRPLVTEKANKALMQSNKVTFEVNPGANKSEIKKAIETLFKVKVLKVNTVTLPAKVRRFGASQSQGSNWKKAVATLKAGDKIELFEGA
ncbi:MAG TPA: 50S ribosomal protein L23 [bacterium]|jgi:large subunit ribosomal protein L23|nr:50S ribosomal protein L23 [bacterium]